MLSNETYEAALRAARAGRLDEAREICDRLIRKDRRDVRSLALLCRIRMNQGRNGDAAVLARKCIAIEPKNAAHHANMGEALAKCGRLQPALRVFDKALRLVPDDPVIIARRADTFYQSGKRERAIESLEATFDAGERAPVFIDTYARLLYAEDRFEQAAHVAGVGLDQRTESFQTRRSLLTVRGKALEKCASYDAAFEAYAAANDQADVTFDARGFIERMDQLIQTFSTDNLAKLPRATHGSETPVFVVGMPRSGSTLVESVIDAHPDATGAGELTLMDDIARNLLFAIDACDPYPKCVLSMTAEQVEAQGRSLIESLQSHDPQASRVTDKQLTDYQHLGLLHMLAPESRIIHCQRDPLDTCLSCYTSNFSTALMPFSTNLRDLGLVYRQYERLMHHWANALDLPMLTVSYEDMVRDPEASMRELIRFLGLEWNEACLRFHERDRVVLTASRDQVNRSVYTSSMGRWKNFRKHLSPLIEVLGEASNDESP